MQIMIILIVAAIQFSLLKIILTFGLTSEDWLLLFAYKTISSGGNFVDNILKVFNATGVYSTTYIIYIGLLESIFKDNYLAYQITNIIFKILATLSLYPLILITFKRKLLAFLTTILFAISYSSTGALQFVVKGSDYLAIFFMNIFLLTYYYYFATRRKLLLLTASVLLFLAFVFSPIRMYPLLGFILLIEIFVWIRSKQLLGFIGSLKRLVVLLLPFLIILRFGPGATGNYLSAPQNVFNFLSYGNYQLLLTPFAGFGYTFLPNDYWPIFGKVTFDNFRNYLFFLLQGPVIIYSILAILLGFLITKRPLLFILGIILTNFCFEIVSYFFVTNLRTAVGPNIKGFYPVSTYAIFFGFFVISVAFAGLIIWLKHKSNILLLSLFAGPIFSSVFLWGTWLIIGDSLTFKEGIHWYLIIPPIGSSLFLASLIVLGVDRIKNMVNPYLKPVLIIGLFLLILPIYLVSSKEINTYFNDLLHIGYGASDLEQIKNKLFSHLKDPLDNTNTLFYFDARDDLITPPLFYPVTVISGFEQKMHIQNGQVINGCIGIITEKENLEKSVTVKEGVRGFVRSSLCVERYVNAGYRDIFYKPENLYALKLKNREVIDIKKETLKNLGFGD